MRRFDRQGRLLMRNTQQTHGSQTAVPGIVSQLLFTLYAILTFLMMFGLLRLALLLYNSDLIGDASTADFTESFINGARFDIRVAIIVCAPLVIALLSRKATAARRWQRIWLTLAASLCLFTSLGELDFYKEFHQRLNSLVFQYMQEDMNTVLGMIWNGFPVARYLVAWVIVTFALWLLFGLLDRISRVRASCWLPSSLGAGISSKGRRYAGAMPTQPTRCSPTISV